MSEATAAKLAVAIIKGNPAERILVIAPNLRHFEFWCRENEINPRARNVVAVTRSDHLRGYSRCWFVDLGAPDTVDGDHLRAVLHNLRSAFGLKNAEVTPEEP